MGRLRAAIALVIAGCAAPQGRPLDLLDEVWSTVRERFYDARLSGVDWPAARERARAALGAEPTRERVIACIRELLAELRASHTALFTPDDPAYYVYLELFWGALEPERRARLFPGGPPPLPGIGVLTEVAADGAEQHVRGVLAGSPAAEGGLVVGDRLLSVEGEPFRAVASFRARVGRPTHLCVQRTRDPRSTLELTVVPEALSPRALFLRALRASARLVARGPRPLAYVHVWSYAGEESQAALSELLLSGPLHAADGLVLDLRGGFGGANPEYLDLFRRDLPALTYRDRSGAELPLTPRWTKPTVLLVDEGTTSGKELFAHGFQRSARGRLVGTRTAGAVLGGQAFLLADGSLLYLAVLDVRVDGERLEGRGVEPDLVVPFERPFSGGRDPQLERALEALEDGFRAENPAGARLDEEPPRFCSSRPARCR